MNYDQLSRVRSSSELAGYVKYHFNGSVDRFFSELNAESDRLIRTDLKKSGQLTAATAGLGKLLPEKFRGHLFRIQARHFHLSSDYRRARKLYEKALDLFQRNRDYGSRSKVQKALLDVLMYVGEYGRAAETGRRALAYFRRTGNEVDAAQVMTNLGNLYHRLDRNRKALDYYNRAYEIFKKIDNDYAMALVQFNRGNVYANLNDLREAARLYHQAGGIYRSLGMDLAACQADYSLAYLDYLNGSYSDALNAFGRVAVEFEKLGDQRCLALTRLDRSDVNLHLNLFSQAIDEALAVSDRFRKLKMSYERGKAYYFAASGYFAYGDYAEALKLTRRAYRLFSGEKNSLWKFMCRFLMARIAYREGKTAEAISEYRPIAAFYRRQGDIRHYFDVRLSWLEALGDEENYGAISRITRSLSRDAKKMTGYQRFLFQMIQGDINSRRGMVSRAEGHYGRAIRQAEKLRSAIFPDEIKRFFWIDKLAAYNRLAAIYLDAGRNSRAFEVLERGKKAAAINFDDGNQDAAGDILPEHLQQEKTRLKAYLRRAMIPVGSDTRAVISAGRVRRAEQRLWQIEQEARSRRGWPGTSEGEQEAGGIKRVQENLAKDELMMRYVCRKETCGVFLIGRDDFEFRPFDKDADGIGSLLARFYFMVNRVGGEDRDGMVIDRIVEKLSEIVYRPFCDDLSGVTKLSIIPDGPLARLPFYLLKDNENRALFEKQRVLIFFGASDFIAAGKRRRSMPRACKASVFAVTEDSLPGASAESFMITRHLKRAKVFTGDRAGSANLLSGLREHGSLVHLIAHASQSYENHLFSRILLADGPVYPFDLIGNPIGSRLVVLSGCQTGDPGLYYYSDSYSLAQTVLMAGAENVIASYWPVADEITGRFMDTFYRRLAREKDIFRALQQTMGDMRAQSPDVRYWAPFYLACR